LQQIRGSGLPERFRIAIIADLDQLSKKVIDGKTVWHSKYQTGTILRSGDKYAVTWDGALDVTTGHNEAGRGCELSELVRFNGHLYSFDDRSVRRLSTLWRTPSNTHKSCPRCSLRTGIMFEVMNPDNSAAVGDAAPYVVPRHIFMEGAGDTDKGLKIEWSTVRDDKLYVGSFGKEYTDSKGNIMHTNNLWVKIVDKTGNVEHVDWTAYYNRIREELGLTHPGYMIHEAIIWSPHHKQWFILPRRVSSEAYNDVEDERRGANTIITANGDFSIVKHREIGVREA
jgi:soluble calcium-activated nucleotidase 1